MQVLIFPDASSFARKSADLVESLIKTFPNSALGLATGSTILDMYKELIRRHQQEGLSFAGVKTFNLDEYVGIPSNQSPAKLSKLYG